MGGYLIYLAVTRGWLYVNCALFVCRLFRSDPQNPPRVFSALKYLTDVAKQLDNSQLIYEAAVFASKTPRYQLNPYQRIYSLRCNDYWNLEHETLRLEFYEYLDLRQFNVQLMARYKTQWDSEMDGVLDQPLKSHMMYVMLGYLIFSRL